MLSVENDPSSSNYGNIGLADVRQKFDGLLKFDSKEDELEHKAHIISCRFLIEVEKVCDRNKISRAELAEMVGTSRSYITQLFRGSKRVNMDMLAKFEDVLGITFMINVK